MLNLLNRIKDAHANYRFLEITMNYKYFVRGNFTRNFIRISETAILIINFDMLTNLSQHNIRVTGKWLVYQS